MSCSSTSGVTTSGASVGRAPCVSRSSWKSSATHTSCTSSPTSKAPSTTGYDVYDVLRAGFPAGTVSGAPKIRAMEIIAEYEPEKRGPYSGAVGYFSYSGNMDTAISLRTMTLRDGVAYLQAGGGIVADSDPQTEYEETLHKMGALMHAIDHAESVMEA